MMTDIKRELTVIKMTNDITIEQVLIWAKGVEAQRAHKTTLDTTNENKDFDIVKIVNKHERGQTMTLYKPTNGWLMGGTEKDMGELITLREISKM